MNQYYRSTTRYINKLSNRLERKLSALYSYEDLTGAQGKIVRYLLLSEKAICQKDIEEEYSIRSSSCTELLNEIERKGYIVRTVNPENHRQKLISLTEKAYALKNSATTQIEELNEELIAGIEKDQLDTCLNVLQSMLKNMEKY